MALFKESEVRQRAKSELASNRKTLTKSLESFTFDSVSERYFDIFLSHAYADKEIILGMAEILEDLNYKVYLDWRDDPQLDRSQVTKATADALKQKMIKSKCLLYSITPSATNSKWMPWELGFKDGHNKKVAILPIVQNSDSEYKGQEYLGVYSHIAKYGNTLYVEGDNLFKKFDEWIKSELFL